MSILEDVLVEEYDRCLRIENNIRNELDELPKGTITTKNSNEKEYYYLHFREGDKIKNKYIKMCDLDKIEKGLNRRKESEKALKVILKSKKQIEKALGKELLNEFKGKWVFEIYKTIAW